MPPPLPAAPLGTAIYPALQNLKVVVELFLDLNCPFSKRMYKTLSEGGVFAAYEAGGKVQWVFHNVLQPWHPTGAIMHEAALAVRSVSGGHFLPFVNAVFDHIEAFSDEATYHKTRAQITEELVGLASSVGVDKATLTAKLALKEGGGNCGTGATQLVKFATKHHRVRGVHVTPTVFVNGQEAVEVSSGWSGEQWRELIDKTLAASD